METYLFSLYCLSVVFAALVICSGIPFYRKLSALVKTLTTYFHKESRRLQVLDIISEEVSGLKKDNKDLKAIVYNLCKVVKELSCKEGDNAPEQLEKIAIRLHIRDWDEK